eukprot:UN16592
MCLLNQQFGNVNIHFQWLHLSIIYSLKPQKNYV